jgi:hypothetical protein
LAKWLTYHQGEKNECPGIRKTHSCAFSEEEKQGNPEKTSGISSETRQPELLD